MAYHSLGEGLMAVQDEKRPCTCRCDCGCRCNDNVSDKTSVSAHILGGTHNSVDLWVSTPSKTKWTFVDEEEVKQKEYYNRLRDQNRELCG